MKLEPLTLNQCELVRQWRNNEMECWRTPFMLTKEMQEDFYRRCCDRNSPHRYWAIVRTKDEYSEGCHPISEPHFIGMGGITYIQWENRIGEITLIIEPGIRGKGYAEKAVYLLLGQAFNHLNLRTVFGECYECNPACKFWRKITDKYKSIRIMLPNRKYWNGKYYNSMYFSIDKDDFNNSNK
jgi:RimJ/RimL family protein N-acetyltransferase